MRPTTRLWIAFLISCFLFVACLVFWWQVALTVGLMFLGTLGYFEKIFEIEWSKKSRILFVVLFLMFSAGQIMYSLHKERELNRKLTESEDTAKKSEQTVKNEKMQIDALVSNNQTLREKLRQAEQKIDVLQYQDVATYSATGFKSMSHNGRPAVPTGIDGWSERFITRRDPVIEFTCGADAIDACKSVIQKVPLYPFSYYFLAKCLKERQDPHWREYALKAQQMFGKTVGYPAHHKEHEKALKDLTEILRK